MHTTRRAALALGKGGLAAFSASPSSARAPLAGRQVPGVQRRRVGAFEVTALLDGHLDLDPALFPEAGPDAAKLLDAAVRPAGPIRTPVNAYAINIGERSILVDAGTGRGYLPTLGGLPDALAAAGIASTRRRWTPCSPPTSPYHGVTGEVGRSLAHRLGSVLNTSPRGRAFSWRKTRSRRGSTGRPPFPRRAEVVTWVHRRDRRGRGGVDHAAGVSARRVPGA